MTNTIDVNMEKIDAQEATASPCVRNCCLDTHDICSGCFRHIDEILVWGNASLTEKETILQKVKLRKASKPNF